MLSKFHSFKSLKLSVKKKIEESDIFGLSSFGFGNINYHIVLSLATNKTEVCKDEKFLDKKEIVVVAENYMKFSDFDESYFLNRFMIGRDVFLQMDTSHFMSLASFDECFRQIFFIDKSLFSNFKVITCFPSPDNIKLDFAVSDFLKRNNIVPKVQVLEKEDLSYGIMSNIASDRVSNFFDFNGKNFNIDGWFDGVSDCFDLVIGEIKKEDSLIAYIYPEFEIKNNKLNIKSVKSYILTSESFALKNNIPIKYFLENKVK